MALLFFKEEISLDENGRKERFICSRLHSYPKKCKIKNYLLWKEKRIICVVHYR